MPIRLEPLRRDDVAHRALYNATFNRLWPEYALTDREFAHELKVAGDGAWWIAFDAARADGADGPVGVVTAERTTWTGATAPPLAILLLDRSAATGATYRVLLDACSNFARGAGFRELRVYLRERDDALAELLATLDGWCEVEVEIFVGRDLTAPGPAPRALPQGVHLTTLARSPHLARSMHACQAAAVADVPGDERHEAPDFDTWMVEHEAPNIPHEAAFLAVERDEDGAERVLGFTQLEVSAARPEVANHDYTVTHPDARGRGVAYAVKLASIEWARMRGYRELRTDNEERNAPMRHINATLGYERVERNAIWRGPVLLPEA